MTKHDGGSRPHFLSRFLGGAVRRRGGFEGPEIAYPPTPNQFPKVIVVDGVAVEPEVILTEDSQLPVEDHPAPKKAATQDGSLTGGSDHRHWC